MADNRPVDSKVVNPQDSATPDTETVSHIANAMPEGEAASLEVTSKAAVKPRRHRFWKTKLLLILVVIGLASWFGYKYTYIFLERRKYARAETALRKVADDLRAQGIETTFSRGCGRTQVVYGQGWQTCSVGITTTNPLKNDELSMTISKFTETLSEKKFTLLRESNSINNSLSPSGDNRYSESVSKLPCSLSVRLTAPGFSNVDVGCGRHSNFKLF